MDSLIGKLRVSLQLDSAAFETGAKRASAEINALGSRAEKAGFAIGSMGKALIAGGAALGSVAIVSHLKQAVSAGLDYASSLGETAQQLGVTTKTLQEYRYAAGQVGISQEEMDAGLAKLTRTIGMALEGSKSQAQAFANLGISLRDANGQVKDAGDVIPEVAKALQGIESPAQRAAVLVELFGKSGMKMGSLMADGAAGVDKLRKASQDLGIVLSDELIAKADEAADTLGQLQVVMDAKVARSVADNTEGVLALADAYAFLSDKALGAIGVMGRMVHLAAQNNDGGLEQFTRDLAARPGFAGALGITVPKPGGPLFPGAAGPLRLAMDAFEKMPARLRANASRPASLLDRPSATRSHAGGSRRGSGSRSAGRSAAQDELGALEQTTVDILASFKPFGDRASEQFTGRAANRLDEIRAKLGDVSKSTSAAARDTGLATVSIAKSFADMADDTVNALQNMSSSIRSGDFLSILGASVKMFTQFGKIGLFGDGIAARLNKVPGFANGTSFAPGGLALVGERGPEYVELPRGSKVYPNGTGPGMGGGRPMYFDLRGAVMTQDLLNQMNMIGAMSAQVGGEIGYGKVARKNARSLS